MPPNPTTTGLSEGRYLALTEAELAALRGTKGDRPRRAWVASTTATTISVADVWRFYVFVGGAEIAFGKSLHRGEMHVIEWLDATKAKTALDRITAGGARESFFAIDEASFIWSHVAFWVKDRWKEEGRTTVLDDQVFARYESNLVKLSSFVEATIATNKHLVFTMSV